MSQEFELGELAPAPVYGRWRARQDWVDRGFRGTHRGGRGGFRGRRTPESSAPSSSGGLSTPRPVIQVEAAPIVSPTIPEKVVELWEDPEERLCGFLLGRANFALRSSATAQSLNLQGLNWLGKNEEHLTPARRHPLWQQEVVASVVNQILPPGRADQGLMEVIHRYGDKIRDFNKTVSEMTDQRWDIRWIIALVGAIMFTIGVVPSLVWRALYGAAAGVLPGPFVLGAVGVGILGWTILGWQLVSYLRQPLRPMRWC
jgi:hypothetical protein